MIQLTDRILTENVYNLLNSVYNLLDIVEDGTPDMPVVSRHVSEVAINLEEIRTHLAQQERLYRMIEEVIAENRELLLKLAKM